MDADRSVWRKSSEWDAHASAVAAPQQRHHGARRVSGLEPECPRSDPCHPRHPCHPWCLSPLAVELQRQRL